LGLVAASVAAQYVVTHPQPSHNINNLSFCFKKEILIFSFDNEVNGPIRERPEDETWRVKSITIPYAKPHINILIVVT